MRGRGKTILTGKEAREKIARMDREIEEREGGRIIRSAQQGIYDIMERDRAKYGKEYYIQKFAFDYGKPRVGAYGIYNKGPEKIITPQQKEIGIRTAADLKAREGRVLDIVPFEGKDKSEKLARREEMQRRFREAPSVSMEERTPIEAFRSRLPEERMPILPSAEDFVSKYIPPGLLKRWDDISVVEINEDGEEVEFSPIKKTRPPETVRNLEGLFGGGLPKKPIFEEDLTAEEVLDLQNFIDRQAGIAQQDLGQILTGHRRAEEGRGLLMQPGNMKIRARRILDSIGNVLGVLNVAGLDVYQISALVTAGVTLGVLGLKPLSELSQTAINAYNRIANWYNDNPDDVEYMNGKTNTEPINFTEHTLELYDDIKKDNIAEGEEAINYDQIFRILSGIPDNYVSEDQHSPLDARSDFTTPQINNGIPLNTGIPLSQMSSGAPNSANFLLNQLGVRPQPLYEGTAQRQERLSHNILESPEYRAQINTLRNLYNDVTRGRESATTVYGHIEPTGIVRQQAGQRGYNNINDMGELLGSRPRLTRAQWKLLSKEQRRRYKRFYSKDKIITRGEEVNSPIAPAPPHNLPENTPQAFGIPTTGVLEPQEIMRRIAKDKKKYVGKASSTRESTAVQATRLLV